MKPKVLVRTGGLRPTEWDRTTVARRLRIYRKDGIAKYVTPEGRVYQPKPGHNPYIFYILAGPPLNSSLSTPY